MAYTLSGLACLCDTALGPSFPVLLSETEREALASDLFPLGVVLACLAVHAFFRKVLEVCVLKMVAPEDV